ncbi:DUF1330 domain-containing protein [uncultured Microbulbifer sp.]|uniref:DUF1330 domain-containing protein n=1 Tax=uncultured Microbulbifer sp. TaxID=348147 RepID=UPI0025FE7E86|nr:DUF1330 domain-containing protein [uncultured Microbulbifer sp.]
METGFIEPTDASAAAMFKRGLQGEVLMLNLLRFREQADYSDFPELAPQQPLTGYGAYKKYMAHAGPLLERRGGEVLVAGEGGNYFIGPQDEQWDMVLLVRYPDQATFLAFASDEEYLAGLGHRTAALADSRLLPIKPKGPAAN